MGAGLAQTAPTPPIPSTFALTTAPNRLRMELPPSLLRGLKVSDRVLVLLLRSFFLFNLLDLLGVNPLEQSLTSDCWVSCSYGCSERKEAWY